MLKRNQEKRPKIKVQPHSEENYLSKMRQSRCQESRGEAEVNRGGSTVEGVHSQRKKACVDPPKRLASLQTLFVFLSKTAINLTF